MGHVPIGGVDPHKPNPMQNLFSRVSNFLGRLTKVSSRPAPKQSRSRRTLLNLEYLEARLTPNNTTFTWTGADATSPTLWADGGNWDATGRGTDM